MTVVAPHRRRTIQHASSHAVGAPAPQVVVQLTSGGRGKQTSLGSADVALRDARLTTGERLAISAVAAAVQLLGQRVGFAGIGDARAAVKLVLRDHDATDGGPWASEGSVFVGTRNALTQRAGARANPGVLITVDAAVHELTHVVQFSMMGANANPNGAILEGIADSAAILATDDDTLGEGFFRRGADGRPEGSIRELGRSRTSGPAIGPVVTTYLAASAPNAEVHAAGGVVSAAFRSLRTSLGRDRAEQLLWTVIRDRPAWTDGGSWRELVAAMRRAATTAFANDPKVAAAVETALHATQLDQAA
jgi:hypothetical protein